MTTLIFIDKENEGDVGAASKDRLRLSSVSSKVLSERSQTQTPLVGRTVNATPARSQSARKALGNVNRTLGTTNKKEIQKQALPAKKITGKTTQVESCSVATEEAYPEIENFFPYNPLDFESFDLPEEHRLSNMSLTGVPLLILDKNIPDRCINMVPSPVKLSPISWECELLQSTANFLSTLDEIIDLPPLS
ncbi:securin [Pangshura tecta]